MSGLKQQRLIIATAAGLAALILAGGLWLIRSIQVGDSERLSFTLYRVSAELVQTMGAYEADAALRGFLILGGRGEVIAKGGTFPADPLIRKTNDYWQEDSLLVYHRQLSGFGAGSNAAGAALPPQPAQAGEGHNQGRQIILWYDPLEFNRGQQLRDAILLAALTLLTLLTLSSGLLTSGLLRAYRHLANQERLALLGQATRTISHELQTPLTAFDLHRQLAEKKLANLNGVSPAEASGIHSHLEAMRQETDRIREVMRNIRRLIQPEQGAFEAVKLDDFVRDFAAALILPEGQTVDVLNAAELPALSVQADRTQLATILRNLCLNAAQSQLAAGVVQPVQLRLVAKTRFCYLEISDAGKGLSKAARSQAFDAFFTTKPDGSGLGLPLSRTLARSMGGELSLRSHHPQGCTASLRLPVFAKQPRKET